MFGEIRRFLFGPPTTRPRDPFLSSCESYLNSSHRRVFNPAYREREQEELRRRQWLSERLWHNGEHAHCCKKCFQAGYAIAATLAERPDLIAEYPELVAVFQQLARDGMLDSALAKAKGYSAVQTASRSV